MLYQHTSHINTHTILTYFYARGLAFIPCADFSSRALMLVLCGQFSQFRFAKLQLEGLKSLSHCLFSPQNCIRKFKSPRGWAQFSRSNFESWPCKTTCVLFRRRRAWSFPIQVIILYYIIMYYIISYHIISYHIISYHRIVQYSIVYYIILYYIIVQYSIVQYSIVQYSIVQYSTVQYSIVQYSIAQHSIVIVQYSIVQYSILQYSIVQYSIVQYSIVQYSIVQYSIVQYSTAGPGAVGRAVFRHRCWRISQSRPERCRHLHGDFSGAPCQVPPRSKLGIT